MGYHCPTCTCLGGRGRNHIPTDGKVTCGWCGYRGDYEHIKQCRKDPEKYVRDLRALALDIHDSLILEEINDDAG